MAGDREITTAARAAGLRSPDTVLAHAASQRARVDTEQIGSSALTFESPVKPLERCHSLVAFDLRERLPAIRCTRLLGQDRLGDLVMNLEPV